MAELSQPFRKLTLQSQSVIADEEENDWEFLELYKEDDEYPETTHESHVTEITPIYIPSGTSYRDKLLFGNAETEVRSRSVSPVRHNKLPWKPSIVVKESSKRRIDKLYGPSSSDATDEGDDPLSEYYESQEFLKGTVSITRSHAISKMRPAALEQKLKRIADKTKV